jgi:DNA (cytosine-5)-methyltransferase 1
VNVGGLFSGIGGWELGLERAGMRIAWHCESDPFCQRVLERHWPDVPCYPDVRELTAASVEPVDVLCGGFPCQDLSVAGKRTGLSGARSGLWFEYLRLIGELRPRYVLVENVPQLRKFLGTVTGGLAEIGYDAEWDCISAKDFGAPHLRRRIWLVAYPQREQLRQQSGRRGGAHRPSTSLTGVDGATWSLANTAGFGRREGNQDGRRGSQGTGARARDRSAGGGEARPAGDWWATEPDVGRVADGVPDRMDRRHSLGNALVPQIAEWIGDRVMAYEQAERLAA